MKTKLLISAVLLLSVFGGCKDGPGEMITVRDYIGGYAMIKNIRAYAGTEMDIMLFEGEVVKCYYRTSDEFQRFREKYGDTKYKARVEVGSPDPTFIVHDFQAVHVISDADYDDLHPAGTSLNDLARFLALSAYPYIQNGYKEYDWESSDKLSLFNRHFSTLKPYWGPQPSSEYKSQLYPIDKIVSALTPDDLKVLGRGHVGYFGEDVETGSKNPLAVILFTTPPTLDKTHTFTVTMENKKDRTFSATVAMTFD